MRAGVTILPLGEPTRFNPGQLEILCDRLGEHRAETEVAHALDRIAKGLTQLGTPTPNGDWTAVADRVAALVEDARLIGMSTLAQAGRHVLDCLDQGDPTALAATLARLARVGDRSINAIWDLDDLSG
ncbi:hypothetical protein LSUCC0031_01445 [Rhodobacterales bacterium LSUCC0031]|nr:hypothetical protein [Rhodobacterales bacterium LSUCC0031]